MPASLEHCAAAVASELASRLPRPGKSRGCCTVELPMMPHARIHATSAAVHYGSHTSRRDELPAGPICLPRFRRTRFRESIACCLHAAACCCRRSGRHPRCSVQCARLQ
ncbi:hypothetical protein GUJ93_ZPchr0004g40086 [Zizania palustris]|uniref:Uncharacterized protein n=1 Tax=Zizania palustris TaxID=103762 RepID=A0A8J5VZI1_ZIZPA|nr:hypothetical protein GUJ93_ZPchr0004g40086 [Zizania palustris]